MEKPKIADKSPREIIMKPGEYYWCACGQSSNQPFCDGSHQETPFLPIQVPIEKEQTVHWCMCKQSGNKPFCDGKHKEL